MNFENLSLLEEYYFEFESLQQQSVMEHTCGVESQLHKHFHHPHLFLFLHGPYILIQLYFSGIPNKMFLFFESKNISKTLVNQHLLSFLCLSKHFSLKGQKYIRKVFWSEDILSRRGFGRKVFWSEGVLSRRGFIGRGFVWKVFWKKRFCPLPVI